MSLFLTLLHMKRVRSTGERERERERERLQIRGSFLKVSEPLAVRDLSLSSPSLSLSPSLISLFSLRALSVQVGQQRVHSLTAEAT